MGLFSTAKLFGMTIRESADDGSDFTNPDADYRRLFLGEDGALHLKDSAGTVTAVGGSAATFSGAHVYHSSTQSMTSGAERTVAFNSERFDTDTFHDNSTNNSRLTIPTTGKYVVSWSIGLDGTPSGASYTALKRGGTVYLAAAGWANQYQTCTTGPIDFTAAQYVELVVSFNATYVIGADDTSNAQHNSEFSIMRVA